MSNSQQEGVKRKSGRDIALARRLLWTRRSVNAQSQDDGAWVAAAVADLPGNRRTAAVLAEYEGLSNGKLAAAMRVSVKSVESRLHRARHALRRALKDLLPPATGRGREGDEPWLDAEARRADGMR